MNSREPAGWLERLPAPRRLLDWFVISNLAFLAVDIYSAHAVNDFAHPAEWVPFWFSIAVTLALLAVRIPSERSFAITIDRAAGWCSLAVGAAGFALHLEGTFFQETTLQGLVFTAPFVAPLAYMGLGFALLLQRSAELGEEAWARWVLILALGGVAGNFILSLADHAQNGFFHPTEWLSVVVSALGVGALASAAFLVRPASRWIAGVLALQVAAGLLGFALHARANLARAEGSLFERLVFGAPSFAPLLFADLALLGALGLWALSRAQQASAADGEPDDAPRSEQPRPGPTPELAAGETEPPTAPAQPRFGRSAAPPPTE